MDIQSISGETNKALVTRFWNEVWNPPYSMETFDKLVADDFTISTDGKCIEGKEAFKEWLTGFQSKIEELKTVPQDILASEDGARVITRMVVSGLNKGLLGTKPNGMPVEFVAISIMEAQGGKLTYNWVERSAFELFQRLTQV